MNSFRDEVHTLVLNYVALLIIVRVLQVFDGLQKRGYIIGPGDIYGGDYCLYKESPEIAHSSATVRVVNERNVCILPQPIYYNALI